MTQEDPESKYLLKMRYESNEVWESHTKKRKNELMILLNFWSIRVLKRLDDNSDNSDNT